MQHRRTRFLYAIVALLASVPACGTDPEEHGSMRLTTMSVDETLYRLRDATFEITGPESMLIDGESDVDRGSIVIDLELGQYEVLLQPGWWMERQTLDGTYEPIEARLVSDNPVAAEIEAHDATTIIRYEFLVPGGNRVEFAGEAGLVTDVYESCDPLNLYSCGEFDGEPRSCSYMPDAQSFVCTPLVDGEPGQPCGFINVCGLGATCLPTSVLDLGCASEGEVEGCCVAYCHVMDGCDDGHACEPLDVPGYPYVGVCVPTG